MSLATPHPCSWDPKSKTLMNQTSSLTQHCQHGWEQGLKGLWGKVHVFTKGKPSSLKKKKEQTRVVHGQTTGPNLCTRPSFSSTEELSPGGALLASQPNSGLGRDGQLHRPLGEWMTQSKSKERTSNRVRQLLPGPTGQRPLSGSRARSSSGQPHLPQSGKSTGRRGSSVL